jgi:FixJ family two-component response regulator
MGSGGVNRTGSLACVLDDDASILRVVQRLLNARGFAVAAFSSASEFLRADHEDLACLVLDVHLGASDGFAVHERLTSSGWRIPVLYVTGHDDAPMWERARQAGAVDYLTKPFDDESLVAAVSRATQQP